MIEACRSIDVRVLDHVIIGGMEYYSFNEMFNIKRNISSLKYVIKY
ncbi:MAG: hypothetical protein EOP33_04805 [Rickettsiaceae bacterium]|nr:MAG: hypothetical protein EOP33_04805 [Rickettsiaceae bacterium]